MTNWIVITVVAAGTYAFRASMFVVVGRRPLPERMKAAMSMVGPAAVSALIASMLFTTGSHVVAPSTAELVAVVAGLAGAKRSGNVAHALTIGLPVFWLITALGR